MKTKTLGIDTLLVSSQKDCATPSPPFFCIFFPENGVEREIGRKTLCERSNLSSRDTFPPSCDEMRARCCVGAGGRDGRGVVLKLELEENE